MLEFEQLMPRHSPQLAEQSIPCFRHEHLLESQFCLQLHRITFSSFWGAGGNKHLTGISLFSDVYQPHWLGSKSCPSPIQICV